MNIVKTSPSPKPAGLCQPLPDPGTTKRGVMTSVKTPNNKTRVLCSCRLLGYAPIREAALLNKPSDYIKPSTTLRPVKKTPHHIPELPSKTRTETLSPSESCLCFEFCYFWGFASVLGTLSSVGSCEYFESCQFLGFCNLSIY